MVTESLANEPLLNLDAAVQVGDGMSVLSSGDLESITGDQDFSLPARRRSLSVRELIAIGLGQVELLSFRVGNEMFAIDLACVEEAVESDAVHAVPDMPEAMLGFIELRGRLVPVFSPSNVLCAQLSGTDGVTLLMRSGDRRVGIAVDDVEDVIVVDMPALRHPMLHNAGDGLLLGVAASGSGLVGILDGSALVAACTGHSFAEAV
ncbi:MAG: chemotaxis protein CheW [Anaerolineae bacterium]|nr:chemotaxis protein CheW [Gemmatimonadaceae bacterium]